MPRKPQSGDKPKVNSQLEGFDIQINEFGEIVSSYDVQKLNAFLDARVDDKKFRGVAVQKREDDGVQAVRPIGQADGAAETAPDA